MAAVILCQKSLDIHDVYVNKVRGLAREDSILHLTCGDKFNENNTVEHKP
jgi:hypothetical protein